MNGGSWLVDSVCWAVEVGLWTVPSVGRLKLAGGQHLLDGGSWLVNGGR